MSSRSKTESPQNESKCEVVVLQFTFNDETLSIRFPQDITEDQLNAQICLMAGAPHSNALLVDKDECGTHLSLLLRFDQDEIDEFGPWTVRMPSRNTSKSESKVSNSRKRRREAISDDQAEEDDEGKLPPPKRARSLTPVQLCEALADILEPILPQLKACDGPTAAGDIVNDSKLMNQVQAIAGKDWDRTWSFVRLGLHAPKLVHNLDATSKLVVSLVSLLTVVCFVVHRDESGLGHRGQPGLENNQAASTPCKGAR
jgi:hypothetical protein